MFFLLHWFIHRLGAAPLSEGQAVEKPQAAVSPIVTSQSLPQKSSISTQQSGDITASLVAQASKHADVKAKIEMMSDDLSAKASEQNLDREEDMKISGKEARYMMMQKLSRQSRVYYFLSISSKIAVFRRYLYLSWKVWASKLHSWNYVNLTLSYEWISLFSPQMNIACAAEVDEQCHAVMDVKNEYQVII